MAHELLPVRCDLRRAHGVTGPGSTKESNQEAPQLPSTQASQLGSVKKPEELLHTRIAAFQASIPPHSFPSQISRNGSGRSDGTPGGAGPSLYRTRGSET